MIFMRGSNMDKMPKWYRIQQDLLLCVCILYCFHLLDHIISPRGIFSVILMIWLIADRIYYHRMQKKMKKEKNATIE